MTKTLADSSQVEQDLTSGLQGRSNMITIDDNFNLTLIIVCPKNVFFTLSLQLSNLTLVSTQ